MPRKRKGGAKKLALGGRKKVGAGRKKRGGSAFGDFFTKGIPNFFTKTIPYAAKQTYDHVLKPVGQFAKDQHVLSSLAGMAGSLHPGLKIPGAIGSAALRSAGWGRHKRGGARIVRLNGGQRGGLSSLNGRLFLV
jgi:hypothetical protein